MISNKTLEEIQRALDIVEVIHGYIPLKKAGASFKALCPFHPEKTPSFMVYPHKQFFICYGCGAGGDTIAFVMRHEHLGFQEAIEVLAQKAGIPIEQISGSSRSSAAHPELYQAHEVAARFYHDLLVNSPEGEAARGYLQRRGLTPETWKGFQLGYAPRRWEGLVSVAQEKGFSLEVLERAGLAIPRQGAGEKGSYDRFRHRAIFPIWDTRGKVIAFGGRVLEDEEGPKYMNSPETELYVKGRILYGFHLAAPHIREKDFCIVVEGYMDLVSPFQHGIRNIVASMGTSLTPEQVRLIRRMTRHVVIVYDGDYAGQNATLRGLDLFLEAEMRVKVAVMPSGTDPDSLIQSKGIGAFAEAIQRSEDLFDYKMGILKDQFDPKELEGRVRICQEMLPTIKRVPSAIQKGEYIKRLAQWLGIAEGLLWTELTRVKLDPSWRPLQGAQSPPRAVMTAEDLLAGLLLEHPQWIGQLKERIPLESLSDPQVKQLLQWMLERHEEGVALKDHRQLLASFPRESQEWDSRLARWLAWADAVEEKERVLEELLQKIEHSRHRLTLRDLQSAIAQAEAAGDEGRTTQLILEYNRLMKSR